jgi:tRNA(Arg) A34 adenosine deaminase TadA
MVPIVDPERRAFLTRLFGAGALALAAGAPARAAEPAHAPFAARAQEMRAHALAAGDQGFGAVVVKDGRVVGDGPSRVVTATDPTAHAEVEAIRDAARRLGTTNLAGCILYSTFRPCRMCEAAAYWAGIQRLYHGAEATDGGAPRLGC